MCNLKFNKRPTISKPTYSTRSLVLAKNRNTIFQTKSSHQTQKTRKEKTWFNNQ